MTRLFKGFCVTRRKKPTDIPPHRIPTALQSFVGGDLMSHPSWTISWDVFSISISPSLRSLSSEMLAEPSPVAVALSAFSAAVRDAAHRRGTTARRSSSIYSILGADGAQHREYPGMSDTVVRAPPFANFNCPSLSSSSSLPPFSRAVKRAALSFSLTILCLCLSRAR